MKWSSALHLVHAHTALLHNEVDVHSALVFDLLTTLIFNPSASPQALTHKAYTYTYLFKSSSLITACLF